MVQFLGSITLSHKRWRRNPPGYEDLIQDMAQSITDAEVEVAGRLTQQAIKQGTPKCSGGDAQTSEVWAALCAGRSKSIAIEVA
jgi:hypothetical protein